MDFFQRTPKASDIKSNWHTGLFTEDKNGGGSDGLAMQSQVASAVVCDAALFTV